MLASSHLSSSSISMATGLKGSFSDSLKMQEHNLLSQFEDIDEPVDDPYEPNEKTSQSVVLLQNSRNSIGRMVAKVGNALSLSGKESKADDSRNTFTPGLDYKLNDEEESKSPAEAMNNFHEVDDLPPDTLNPAVAALRRPPAREESPQQGKKYC